MHQRSDKKLYQLSTTTLVEIAQSLPTKSKNEKRKYEGGIQLIEKSLHDHFAHFADSVIELARETTIMICLLAQVEYNDAGPYINYRLLTDILTPDEQ